MMDSTIIAKDFSVKELGYYALSRQITNGLLIIPNMISMIFLPKIIFILKEKGSLDDVKKKCFQMITLSIVFTLPILIVLYLALPFLISNYFVDYAGGISSARINIFSIATSILFLPSVVLIAMLESKKLIVFYALTLLSFYCTYYSNLFSFQTIESIAVLKLMYTTILGILITSLVYLKLK
jgi:O-antigen/teichoic acid export membrane protein